MKTKLAITTLVLASSLALAAPAMAEDEFEHMTQCEKVGYGAEQGMIMRQSGMPFAEAYLSNVGFRLINTMAYEYPIVEPQAVDFVAKAFGIQIELRCELDGIRWTQSGEIAFGSRY